MQHGLEQQKLAVESGYWPLMRYNPDLRHEGRNPFLLDSHRPTIPLKDFAYREVRYNILARTNPQHADDLMKLAQDNVDVRWNVYEEMASRGDARYHFTEQK